MSASSAKQPIIQKTVAKFIHLVAVDKVLYGLTASGRVFFLHQGTWYPVAEAVETVATP